MKFNRLILPLILLLAGLYLVPINIFKTDFSKVPGDFGDARFNNYILEHGFKYFTGKVDKYWDAPFMYPYKNVIAISDNLLGTVPIYSVFRLIGKDRETAYQLWLLSMFILNFVYCFWVLIKWSNNSILSGTGAYIYAFSIFILGHIYNVQTFPRFIVPFVFYWSWKYLSEKKLKYFILVLLGVVYQFYCGIYLGFFLVYALLFFLIAYLIVYRDRELLRQFKNIRRFSYHFLATVAAAILLAPLMLPYIHISQQMGMRSFEDTLSSIPHLRSYFFTSEAPLLWHFLSEHGKAVFPQWWCHHLFMGALPWIGILAFPVVLFSPKINNDKKKFIVFIFIGLLLTFIFSLAINGYTLYRIIFKIPGFSSMRAINRVINIEVIYFILLLVFIFNELQKTKQINRWILMSLPLFVVADNLIDSEKVMRYDKRESQNKIEAVKQEIKNQFDGKCAAIAYMPVKIIQSEAETFTNVMLASQALNIPCVNAYTGSLPNAFISFFNSPSDSNLKKWCLWNNCDKNTILPINDIGRKEKARLIVHLKNTNGKYLSADQTIGNSIVANRDYAGQWETFLLVILDSNKCILRASNNKFLSQDIDKENKIMANANNVNEKEVFTMIPLDSHMVGFKNRDGKYLSVDQNTLLILAKSDSIGNKEIFKILSIIK